MSILLPQTLVMHQNLDLKPQKTLKPQTSTLDPNLIQYEELAGLDLALQQVSLASHVSPTSVNTSPIASTSAHASTSPSPCEPFAGVRSFVFPPRPRVLVLEEVGEPATSMGTIWASTQARGTCGHGRGAGGVRDEAYWVENHEGAEGGEMRWGCGWKREGTFDGPRRGWGQIRKLCGRAGGAGDGDGGDDRQNNNRATRTSAFSTPSESDEDDNSDEDNRFKDGRSGTSGDMSALRDGGRTGNGRQPTWRGGDAPACGSGRCWILRRGKGPSPTQVKHRAAMRVRWLFPIAGAAFIASSCTKCLSSMYHSPQSTYGEFEIDPDILTSANYLSSIELEGYSMETILPLLGNLANLKALTRIQIVLSRYFYENQREAGVQHWAEVDAFLVRAHSAEVHIYGSYENQDGMGPQNVGDVKKWLPLVSSSGRLHVYPKGD
ncbi:hypothetical protein B0H14DRAFT_3593879 [Mycena olivaceomarginata]|nr:hypothetical protein B0H14DRAFT_3593879 [Mycena olivaceomarginata]